MVAQVIVPGVVVAGTGQKTVHPPGEAADAGAPGDLPNLSEQGVTVHKEVQQTGRGARRQAQLLVRADPFMNPLDKVGPVNPAPDELKEVGGEQVGQPNAML